jgi:hypothetical protein
MFSAPAQIPGDPLRSTLRREAFTSYVGPGYFRTVGIPIMVGRDFSDGDDEGGPSVGIVNQAFVQEYFPGVDPIGRSFLMMGVDTNPVTIVGVVRDMPYFELRDSRSASVFRPMKQGPNSWTRLILRYTGTRAALERDLRSVIRALAPRLPIDQIETLAASRDAFIVRERMLALISTLVGILALTLAVVGVYGITAHSVAKRTREIGIRVAIGAQKFDVLWLFAQENLRICAVGIAAGLLLSLAAESSVRTLLYGVPSTDLASLLLAAAILLAVTFTATLIPLLRGLSRDPVGALGSE